MRLTALLVSLLLLLCACAQTPETHTGYVRSVANYNREIVFEDEDLGLFTCVFSFNEATPPLWKGMHARFTFFRDGLSGECIFQAVKHLPPDASQ